MTSQTFRDKLTQELETLGKTINSNMWQFRKTSIKTTHEYIQLLSREEWLRTILDDPATSDGELVIVYFENTGNYPL